MSRARTAWLVSLGGLALVASSRTASAAACGTDTVWCVDNAAGGAAFTSNALGLAGFGLANLYVGAGTNVVALAESNGSSIFSGVGASFGATISTEITPVWWSAVSSSIFFAANDGYVYSRDAASGACNWRTYVGRTPSGFAGSIVDATCGAADITNGCGDTVTGNIGGNPGATAATTTLYVATNDGAVTGSCPAGENRIYALNAATGAPVWTFNAPASGYEATAGSNTVGTIKNGVLPDVWPDGSCTPSTARNQLVFADSSGVAYVLDSAAGTLLNGSGRAGIVSNPASVFQPQYNGAVCGAAYVGDNADGSIHAVSIDPTTCGGIATTPCTVVEAYSGPYTPPIRFSLARGANSAAADRFLVVDGSGRLNVSSPTAKCVYQPATGKSVTGTPFEIGGVAYAATTEGSVVGVPLGATQKTDGSACNGYQERFFSDLPSSIASSPAVDFGATQYEIIVGDQAGRLATLKAPFNAKYSVVVNVSGYPSNIGSMTVTDTTNGLTANAKTNGAIEMPALNTGKTYSIASTTLGALTCTPSPTSGTIAGQDGLVNLACATSGCAYRSQVTYATAAQPSAVAAADFDGDGKLDLAVADYSNNKVSVLLNTGNATFATQVPYGTGSAGTNSGPLGIATGDFNADGKTDIVVADFGNGSPFVQGTKVSVLLNAGSGTFGGGFTAFPVGGGGPQAVAVADFDGDGKLDLATANGGNNTVGVLLGTGTGSFGAPTTRAVGLTPEALAAGDLNGDGKPDLVVANSALGSTTVSVLINTGGSFAGQVTYTVGAGPHGVVLADLDGDGKLDLATANAADNDVSVLVGVGNGTFGAQVTYAVGTNPFSLGVGDFDGDGIADLAVANEVASTISLLRGTGSGVFGAATTFASGSTPYSLVVADVNSDTTPDIVVANQGDNDVGVLYDTGSCCSNTTTNVYDCGGCGVLCSSHDMATVTCGGGTCNGTCATGFSDCNANRQSDGCETPTSADVNNCGGCSVVCSSNHVTPSCAGGACGGTCLGNFKNCNGTFTDGCETNVNNNANNCGACGIACSANNMATRTCGGGVCNGTCAVGFGDCNSNLTNDGCETNLNTSNSNCAVCGHACPGAQTCVGGVCQ